MLSKVRQERFTGERDKDLKWCVFQKVQLLEEEMTNRDAGLSGTWLRYFVAILSEIANWNQVSSAFRES